MLPLVVACGARGASPTTPDVEDEGAIDIALRAQTAQRAPRVLESRRLRELEARWSPKTLGAPAPVERPLGRRERVTVRFAEAELGEALRLLADAGGFALVVDGELRGRVTADLRRVRPYSALISLAETHGARVERRGSIVLVTPR